MKLYPFQESCVGNVLRAVTEGSKGILVCSPTGSGKTIIAVRLMTIIEQWRKRVLFLVGRRELIDQTSRKLLQGGVRHGVIMGRDKRESLGLRVQLASIQTVVRRKLPLADFIIIDEAHHTSSSSYLKLLAQYPDAVKIGFTATPQRLDGRALDKVFTVLIEAATIGDLIGSGLLMKPTVFGFGEPNLDNVVIKDGDYDAESLANVLDEPKMIGKLVENWHEYARGRKTIAYGANISHSEHIAETFATAGIKSTSVSSKDSNGTRERAIKELEAGKIDILVNCALFTEGIDIPALSCAILSTPTLSLSKYLQMVGRVVRVQHGKPAPIVLDHAGCHVRHGLPYLEREWNLEGKPMVECSNKACCYWYSRGLRYYLRSNAKKEIILCPRCSHGICPCCKELVKGSPELVQRHGTVTLVELVCPSCNSIFREEVEDACSGPIERKERVEVSALLHCVDGLNTEQFVIFNNDYLALAREARERGRRRSWIMFALIAKYGKVNALRLIPRHSKEWWNSYA
jgi:DNA repair protein RadD